jgi:outer membrane protein assembly factor BamB
VSELLFIGIKGRVLALDHDTGSEVWRTQIGSDYVSVTWDGQALFATTSGEIWRLNPRDGSQIWHNALKGLGLGLVSLASTTTPSASPGTDVAETYRRAAEAGAADAAIG